MWPSRSATGFGRRASISTICWPARIFCRRAIGRSCGERRRWTSVPPLRGSRERGGNSRSGQRLNLLLRRLGRLQPIAGNLAGIVDLRHVGLMPEVELDHHAVGIVQEDLLERPRRHLADLERDLVLLDAVDRAADVGAVDRDMVDRAAAMVLAAAFGDEVQDRLFAGIEPGAGEIERRAVAGIETDMLLVEVDGLLQVLAEHIPMVERQSGHGFLLATAGAYTHPGSSWQPESQGFSAYSSWRRTQAVRLPPGGSLRPLGATSRKP